MKLVLYGGGNERDNLAIDQAVLKHVAAKKPKITYIPASSFDYEEDFQTFVRHYTKLHVHQIISLPVDQPVDSVMQKYALTSDVLHLSGGNTFYFLHHLRRSGFLSKIRQFVARGGMLTGLSAGAILMTPNIHLAAYPSFDCDENVVGLKNFRALGLVDFEFFPHYINSKRYDEAMRRYSEDIPYPLYACPDGSGVFVHDQNKTFFGPVYCFHHGAKLVV